MSLRYDMYRYEQITGESAEHVPIIRLGAFLDGYDAAITKLRADIEGIEMDEQVKKLTLDIIDKSGGE